MIIVVSIVCWFVGYVIGRLIGRYRFSCRKIGHVWEYRRQIDGVHYRDPGVEAFRVCERCGHVESIDKVTSIVDEVFTMTNKTFVMNKTLVTKPSVCGTVDLWRYRESHL